MSITEISHRSPAFDGVINDAVEDDGLPASGTEVRINDEQRGIVAGNDFFRALLEIWLGSSPVSKSLKADMLGLD